MDTVNDENVSDENRQNNIENAPVSSTLSKVVKVELLKTQLSVSQNFSKRGGGGGGGGGGGFIIGLCA